MQSFKYSDYPTQITWVLLPGLHSEHLILEKFMAPNMEKKSYWETIHCLGSSYEYTLFDSHPSTMDGVIAQLTGSKNVRQGRPMGKEVTPLWHPSYKGHKIAILELGLNQKSSRYIPISLTQLASSEFSKFDSVLFFKMFPKDLSTDPTGEFFNSSDWDKGNKIKDRPYFKTGHTYYDSSCVKKQKPGTYPYECQNTLESNVEFIYDYLRRNEEQFIFIILDYRYLWELEQENPQGMHRILQEYGGFFDSIHEKSFRYLPPLTLLTAPTPQMIQVHYEDKTNMLRIKDLGARHFISPVFAKGARAENFCGIYEQSEILHRFLLKNNKDKILR